MDPQEKFADFPATAEALRETPEQTADAIALIFSRDSRGVLILDPGRLNPNHSRVAWEIDRHLERNYDLVCHIEYGHMLIARDFDVINAELTRQLNRAGRDSFPATSMPWWVPFAERGKAESVDRLYSDGGKVD